MMTPGVISRPHNDGSGRQNYFGNAVEHRDAVTLMEGLYAGNYNDFNINRTGLSSEAIQDTEIKTGGVDAGSPMGYGLVINMISKSGGNQFRGSAALSTSRFDWNANNVGDGHAGHPAGAPVRLLARRADQARSRPGSSARCGSPTTRAAPAGRRARSPTHKAFFPEAPLGDNTHQRFQPWVKVTTKLGANHDLSGIYQADRLLLNVVGAEDYEPVEVLSTGGPMYGAKLTSVWGQSVTTTFSGSYNTKGGNASTATRAQLTGPLIEYHREAFVNQGIARRVGPARSRRAVVVDRLRRLL